MALATATEVIEAAQVRCEEFADVDGVEMTQAAFETWVGALITRIDNVILAKCGAYYADPTTSAALKLAEVMVCQGHLQLTALQIQSRYHIDPVDPSLRPSLGDGLKIAQELITSGWEMLEPYLTEEESLGGGSETGWLDGIEDDDVSASNVNNLLEDLWVD